MRTINLTFEDKDFDKLNKLKIESNLKWENFVISLYNFYKGEIKNNPKWKPIKKDDYWMGWEK